MKCITLRNPHAAAVVLGRRAEIWRPDTLDEADYGPVLIHASGAYDAAAKTGHHYPLAHRRGQILGFAEVLYMGDTERVRGQPLTKWILRHAMVFPEPVTWSGSRGVYDVPDELVLDQIERALKPEDGWDHFSPKHETPVEVVYPPTRGNWRGD